MPASQSKSATKKPKVAKTVKVAKTPKTPKIAKPVASKTTKKPVVEGEESAKKHRRMDRATLLIRRYQNPNKCPETFWRPTPFRRNIRAIMQILYGPNHPYQFSAKGLYLIQKWAEDDAFNYIKAGNFFTQSSKKVILTPAHLASGEQVRVLV